MRRNTDTWILTAQCPSRLGTVDVVTRFYLWNNPESSAPKSSRKPASPSFL